VAVALAEVIEDGDVVAFAEEDAGDPGADEAGAAGDEDVHAVKDDGTASRARVRSRGAGVVEFGGARARRFAQR
jgi:hypothetical protein